MNGLKEWSQQKISILESGQTKWDFIRQLTRSGAQDNAFLVIDLDDIVLKHKEWKMILPRITPFYGKIPF